MSVGGGVSVEDVSVEDVSVDVSVEGSEGVPAAGVLVFLNLPYGRKTFQKQDFGTRAEL